MHELLFVKSVLSTKSFDKGKTDTRKPDQALKLVFPPGISRPGISREKAVSKIPVSRDFYGRVPGNILVL